MLYSFQLHCPKKVERDVSHAVDFNIFIVT